MSPSGSPSHGATAAAVASQTLVLGDDESGGGGGGFSRPKTARGRGDDPFGYVSPSRERDPAAVQTLKLDGGPSSSPGLSVSLTTAADNGASPIGSPYDEAEDVEYLEGEEVEYDEGEYADEAPFDDVDAFDDDFDDDDDLDYDDGYDDDDDGAAVVSVALASGAQSDAGAQSIHSEDWSVVEEYETGAGGGEGGGGEGGGAAGGVL